MMPRREEKGVNEHSTRGNMGLLVSVHVLLSSQDTLLSSRVIYYGVQAGPVSVLHVVSITGSVVQLLTHSHTSHSDTYKHTNLAKILLLE